MNRDLEKEEEVMEIDASGIEDTNNGGGPQMVQPEGKSSSGKRKKEGSSSESDLESYSPEELRNLVSGLRKRKRELEGENYFLTCQNRGQDKSLAEKLKEKLGNARTLPKFEDKFKKGDDWNFHWIRFSQYCATYESLTEKQKSSVLEASIDKSLRGLAKSMGGGQLIPSVAEINQRMARACRKDVFANDSLLRWELTLQNVKQREDECLLEFASRIRDQWDAFKHSPEFLNEPGFIQKHERTLFGSVLTGLREPYSSKIREVVEDWNSGNRQKSHASDLESLVDEIISCYHQMGTDRTTNNIKSKNKRKAEEKPAECKYGTKCRNFKSGKCRFGHEGQDNKKQKTNDDDTITRLVTAIMKKIDDKKQSKPTCPHCKRVGHLEPACWDAHPELRPKKFQKKE